MKIPPNYNYEKLYFRRFIINRIRNSISINCRVFRRKPKLKMKTTEEKNLLLAELKAHEIADEFVRGTWLADDGVKGCFYGCTMKTQTDAREKFAEKYDIDLWYCYLTEKIFENLPGDQFKSFPHDSIEIIPLNFDFNKVKSEWNKTILLQQLNWITDKKVREVLENTAKLFDIPFNEIDKEVAVWSAESAARSAESAAWSAAESAAESAAWSAARSAVRSAESAAWSAESAAWSAAESAAWSAVRSAARSAESAAWSAESVARSAAESAAWSAVRSAARLAESAAWSAAESVARSAESVARSAAESAAWSVARSAAKQNHYVWMRDTLFTIIKKHS